MDYGRLPATGAGIALGGVFINEIGILAIAIVLIAVGATLIRTRFRRGQSVS